MNPFQLLVRTLRLGWGNILQHKLRSGLTILGIVFGVCSVVSMLAIGEGASRQVQDQIRRLGSQNIIVRSVKPPEDASTSNSGGSSRSPNAIDYGLRYADAERLYDTLPSVRVLVPIKARSDEVRVGSRAAQATVLGTVPWYAESMDLKVVRGRFIGEYDMARTQNVCAIGERLAREIFLFRDPLGQSLWIGRQAYRVVGVVGGAGGGTGGGGEALPSDSADVFVPLTTLRALEGDLIFKRQAGSQQSEYVELHELIVTVDALERVASTADLVEKTLMRDRKSKDYETIVPLRLLEEARRTQRIFSVVLGSIAAISLLVGGIGIMNIMLASVSERTREIGVRRALGARRRDIMAQFLIECTLLSVGGGILGMILGAAIPSAVTRFSGMPTALTPGPFVLAFVVSVFIGIVFGLYPARRAAAMDPIDALRHE